MQEQDQVKEPVDGFDDKNLRGGVGEEGRKLGGYYYYSKSGKGKGKGSKGGKSGGYYVYMVDVVDMVVHAAAIGTIMATGKDIGNWPAPAVRYILQDNANYLFEEEKQKSTYYCCSGV
eukprot:CAMPEP_0176484114 /NCGR_PEP_ID=MMETSP0200_2-20121128/4281_1 /TAXON_ID=947934 /ORGANISM="Chaetoceros sp., Strain GSL56" /LENGTH=117 /DNA_ID=CAMNT_0017880565 /DNA_START=776 /DNA_END=1130 /DNA_ORIENTATION=+